MGLVLKSVCITLDLRWWESGCACANNECAATNIPSSATGTASPSGTGKPNATQAGAESTATGDAATGTGGLIPSASETQSGTPAESTGAAGKLEVGLSALIAGLGVMAASL